MSAETPSWALGPFLPWARRPGPGAAKTNTAVKKADTAGTKTRTATKKTITAAIIS